MSILTAELRNRTSIFVIYFSFTLWGWLELLQQNEKISPRVSWYYWLSLGRLKHSLESVCTAIREANYILGGRTSCGKVRLLRLWTLKLSRKFPIRKATSLAALATPNSLGTLWCSKAACEEKNGCILKQQGSAAMLSMKLMVSLHLISSIKKSERRRVLLLRHLIPESPSYARVYSASFWASAAPQML